MTSDDRPLPPAVPRLPSPESYTLHPLQALDGVFIYVTAGGETIGYYFGATEEAAAAAVAEGVVQRTSEGAGS